MPIQLHQAINLLTLLSLALLGSNIYLSWRDILSILVFTLLLEYLLLYFNKERKFYLSYASLSTAVGVIILMYANSLWIYFLAITLALFQKHFLLIKGKHLFNPSNFAIIVMLALFYDKAHILTGQLGDNFIFSLIVLVLATSILIRVNRWLISLVFLILYLFFQYFLIILYDPSSLFSDIYHRLYSVSFMLFIYFMLTDPSVTPNSLKGQVLYALFVALVVSLLDRWFGFRVQHLFMSVFFISFLNSMVMIQPRIPELKKGLIMLSFLLALLGYIEYQEPYYFEMNG